MIRSTRTIILLAAFWLVTLTAPAAAAVTGWSVCTLPAAEAAKDGERAAACPMKKSARHTEAPCCCCGADVSSKTHPSPSSESAAISDLLSSEDCVCSFTPVPPATQQPQAIVVLPFFPAAALLAPPALAPLAPRSIALLPQAPIRGPAAVLQHSPFLGPDAGRAPPSAV